MESFVVKIISDIERLFSGVIAWGYKDTKTPSNVFYMIAINNYDIYTKDSRFAKLRKAWHKAAESRGGKIVFCYLEPTEKKMLELAEKDNLLMNCC